MASSNGSMQKDVFQMGPGTLRSVIAAQPAHMYMMFKSCFLHMTM